MPRLSIHWSWLLAVCMLSIATMSSAQQEAPQDESEAKHIKASIEDYIKNDLELKGAFLLSDPKQEQVLKLTFDELHKSVGTGEDGSPFVCADFRDSEGKTYDVDVYVNKTNGTWTVKKLVIHKVDGEVRR